MKKFLFSLAINAVFLLTGCSYKSDHPHNYIVDTPRKVIIKKIHHKNTNIYEYWIGCNSYDDFDWRYFTAKSDLQIGDSIEITRK